MRKKDLIGRFTHCVSGKASMHMLHPARCFNQGWAEQRFGVTEGIPRKREKSHGIPSFRGTTEFRQNLFRGSFPRKKSTEFFRGTSAAELFRGTKPRNFPAEFSRGKPNPSPTTGLKKWPW